ncbi:MAG: preprotein translocase subunit YajC [Gammaproteobacteria bacterium]|nr:preprotein translocase subunit YajC [Gammaproteobacteria bacterium]
MSFLISDAFAEGAAGAPQGDPTGSMIFFLVLFAVFYFILIRPQQKRAKEHRALVESLAKGDEVVTNGGMLGKITGLSDNFVSVEVANGVEIKIQRSAIHAVLPKGTIKSA